MSDLLLSKSYGVKQFLKKGSILKCFSCGKDVYARPSVLSRKKFCSRSCFFKDKKPKTKTGKYAQCVKCGKDFWMFPSRTKSRFCSFTCANGERGGKTERICENCGKLYRVNNSQEKWRGTSRYCSRACTIHYKRVKVVMQKRNKNTSNQSLKKQLWLYFSKYIRQRDNGKCISCGKEDNWRNTDAGHYIPKTAGLSLYFDEKNVNCQCTSCNRWKHGNLSSYAIALMDKHGKHILRELDERKNKTIRISNEEYVALIGKYKTLIVDNGFHFK